MAKIPGSISSMEMTLDNVCPYRRGLLRRRLHAELIYVVVVIAPILSGQASFNRKCYFTLTENKTTFIW